MQNFIGGLTRGRRPRGLPASSASGGSTPAPTSPGSGAANAPARQIPQETDADLVALVQRRYRYSRQQKDALLQTWATCLAFYVGEHWRKWEPQQRRLVQPTQIPAWRILMVDNQIPGIIETAASKLARSRQMPRALPNTDEPEDQQAAQLGSRVLEHWWRIGSMERRELECNIQRILFGAGFFHDYWDPSAKGRVPTTDPTTGETRAVQAPVGDVRVEVLSVFDVFPEPTEEWEQAGWVIVSRRRPLHWFADVFGQKGAAVQPDQGGTEDVYSMLLPGMFGTESAGGFATGAGAPTGEGLATLHIYYQAPGAQYPQGRTFMTAGDQLLYREDALPMPHGEIPVTMLAYRYVPKRTWPMGLVEHLLGQQRELNRGQGNLAEWIRLYRAPKWLVPRGAKLAEKSITAAPDEVIEYTEGSGPPVCVPPPGMPASLLEYPDQQREALRQLSGQHEVSQGSIPTGVTAAAAIGLLQQSDNVRLSTPAMLGRDSLERLARHVLVTIVERYREPRLIATFGRDRTQQVIDLVGADIGDRDVLVDLTEGVEDSDAIRQQQFVDMMTAGVFQLPAPLADRVLRDIGMQWLADALQQAAPQMQAEQQATQQQVQQQQDAQAQQALAQQGQQQQQAAAQAQAQQQQQAQATMLQQAAQAAAKQQSQVMSQQHDLAKLGAEQGHEVRLEQQRTANQATLAPIFGSRPNKRA